MTTGAPTVTIYFNEHPDHWFGYQPGHPLRQVFSYEASTDAAFDTDGDPETVADEAFVWFNADPDALADLARATAKRYRVEELRSLSKGDVVRVGEVWLACTSAGWQVLDHEPLVTS